MSTKTGSLQSISISQNESETLNQNLIQRSERKKPSSTIVFPSLTNIAALFVKNSITMKRNILLLLFVFFLPAIVVFVNSITIGKVILFPVHTNLFPVVIQGPQGAAHWLRELRERLQ